MPKGVYKRKLKPLKQRLLSHVVEDANGCWLWKSTVNGSGYGTIGLGPASLGKDFVHRVAWRLYRGRITAGKLVCHRCDVRTCCNHAHLFLGTYLVNARDAATKGRLQTGDKWRTKRRMERRPRGEQHGRAKLTESQVAEIRAKFAAGGVNKTQLAIAYKVCRANIRFILSGRTWKTQEAPGS